MRFLLMLTTLGLVQGSPHHNAHHNTPQYHNAPQHHNVPQHRYGQQEEECAGGKLFPFMEMLRNSNESHLYDKLEKVIKVCVPKAEVNIDEIIHDLSTIKDFSHDHHSAVGISEYSFKGIIEKCKNAKAKGTDHRIDNDTEFYIAMLDPTTDKEYIESIRNATECWSKCRHDGSRHLTAGLSLEYIQSERNGKQTPQEQRANERKFMKQLERDGETCHLRSVNWAVKRLGKEHVTKLAKAVWVRVRTIVAAVRVAGTSRTTGSHYQPQSRNHAYNPSAQGQQHEYGAYAQRQQHEYGAYGQRQQHEYGAYAQRQPHAYHPSAQRQQHQVEAY